MSKSKAQGSIKKLLEAEQRASEIVKDAKKSTYFWAQKKIEFDSHIKLTARILLVCIECRQTLEAEASTRWCGKGDQEVQGDKREPIPSIQRKSSFFSLHSFIRSTAVVVVIIECYCVCCLPKCCSAITDAWIIFFHWRDYFTARGGRESTHWEKSRITSTGCDWLASEIRHWGWYESQSRADS